MHQQESGQRHLPPRVPETQQLAFDQVMSVAANAPHFETTVNVPAGAEDWRISVSCRDQGVPCRRASVSLELEFDQPAMPAIRVALRPDGAASPPARPGTCFEDYVSGAPPHSRCTLHLTHGWEDDTDGSRARRDFLARVDNTGHPLQAHAILSVIDPLE